MNYKIILAAVCSLILLVGCAPILSATRAQEEKLVKIKTIPGVTQDELFSRSLSWAARTYNSANDVIQLKDQINGQIVCRGLGSAPMDMGFVRHFRYTMIIDIKEDRIRVRYENIRSEDVGRSAGPDMHYTWKYIENYFHSLSDDLFSSLSKYKKEKDW